ncbi:MAG: hypothetical protein H0W01_06050, partial [Pseudonocardiales bacterium]|nr:hypothetical protein [Pseudonocardiales bacterium]
MRWARHLIGVVGLGVAVAYLVAVVDGAALREVAGAVFSAPFGLLVALIGYGMAFGLRAWAWCEVLPGLSRGQSWAALHVSLLGNHLLPLRLGEVLRVTSVLRRTSLPARPVIASAITLRAADLVVVLALALVVAPAALAAAAGGWLWAVAGLMLAVGVGAGWWTWRLARRGSALRLPTLPVGLAVLAAWVLEAAVVFQVAQLAGFPLSVGAAVAVTAVTVA